MRKPEKLTHKRARRVGPVRSLRQHSRRRPRLRRPIRPRQRTVRANLDPAAGIPRPGKKRHHTESRLGTHRRRRSRRRGFLHRRHFKLHRAHVPRAHLAAAHRHQQHVSAEPDLFQPDVYESHLSDRDGDAVWGSRWSVRGGVYQRAGVLGERGECGVH